MRKIYFLLFMFCISVLFTYAQSTTFSYTGTVQTYTVPAGITSLAVDVAGAQGGNYTSPSKIGGLGGRAQGTVAVTPGQVLHVYVGQQPVSGSCGSTSVYGGLSSGGGADGGNGSVAGGCGGAGGGGASDIRTVAGSSFAALSSRLLVGAGGGGAGYACGEDGGGGGGLTGMLGNYCGSTASANIGQPGTQTAGGAPGSGSCSGTGATAGGFGFGGNACTNNWGAGGGGGYYGGGGCFQGSASGGSSFIGGTGVTGGTTTASYRTGNGQVIITPLCSNPPASTGSGNLCAGGSTTFSNTVASGTWSSSNTAVASIVAGTGVLTASSTGTANITYSVPGGCFSSRTVTVTAAPSVSGIATNSPLCANSTLTLTAGSPVNVTSFLWEGPAAIIGTSTSSASVPGIGTSGSGTYSLTVTNGTGVGCVITYTTSVSVLASPASITGTASVCQSFSTTLVNSVAGGSWTSTNTSVAPISSSGVVTGSSAGTAIISYALSSGCASTREVTVNALPLLVISPSSSATVCLNNAASFSAVAPGATFDWVGVSGATGLSCTSCAAPAITPMAIGANVYSVTATSGAGCTTTSGVTVTVNELPSDISGSSNVCVGTATTLTCSAGGEWTSSNVGVAAIGISSGVVTGLSTGTVTISYTLPTGCRKTAVMNVLATPAPIGGTAAVCSGLTTNLTHPVSGGTWTSSDAVVASVNPSGVVTGGNAGNATISYTLPSGCIVTALATVNTLPAAIGGTAAVCELATTTLTNADAGGTWASSSSNATVNASSGVVTGVTAGMATVSYTMANGCYRTRSVTVNAIPANIGGTLSTCHNTITVLSNTTPGGTWLSGAPGTAFVDASGVVTGITPGIATISYTLSTGCRKTAAFTVNALPSVIDGTLSVCVNSTTTLSNADGGGTWASSNTGVATINTSGEATGISAGNATITYTLATGCRKTASLTVNALPVPISGTAVTCVGSSTTLYNFSSGGTWTSGAPGVANILPTGEVTGVSAGLANITYQLPSGCIRTQIVTVNALPAAITGNLAVCAGQTTNVSSSSAGGAWSSSTPGTASIDASGLVSGITAGNAVVTYTLPNGCERTAMITVNALPANITGTPSVCVGLTTSFNNGTPGGAWTSESDLTATVSGAGVVTGVEEGSAAITYTLGTGCYRTRTVSVNPLPASIGGIAQVCVGLTTDLSNSTIGGAWSTGAPGTASVNTSGTVSGLSAGNANITYTLPTGCRSSVAVVVNPLPNAITGALNACVNATTTLNNSSAGGMWSSGNTSVASINSSGVVTGVSAGMSAITYTLPTGCIRTANVNINPLPAPISGVLNVCQGLTTALGNSSPGGAWSSSAPGTASVNTLGVVSGVSVGTANITYTLPTSCRIAASLVVNSLPAAITGNTQVCAGSTTTLSNTTINGSWSTSSPSIATVDGSGTVSGIMAGTAVITYTLPTGCYKTTVVNVNPLPLPIVGSTSVCQGLATGLSNASGGGTWSSSNGTIAPISGAGVVNGIAPGVTVISYTLPTGCASTLVMAVDPTPAVITGSGTVCAGSTTMMSTTTSGGFWGSASAVASVSFLGEVSGMSAGTATITYILPSGCFRTRQITVNALPATITGSDNVCVGSQTTLSSTSAGGTWNSNSEPHALINAATGEISGVSAGTMLISYTLPTTCMRVRMITVNTTPAAITGSMEICNGGVTTLNTTSTGGVWISGNTSVAIVGLAGGNVTGLSAGTSSISYTMPTGCMTSTVVTVNANPGSIMGITSICDGSSTVLSNASLGGMWSISAPSVADISGAGVLSGISAGNAIVTYTLPSGCNTTTTIAVNELPATANVTGGGSYCAGGAGVNVGLDGSDALTTYKLYRGTTLAGTYSGTGAPIHFGTFTNAGMYMVTATSASGCNSNMSGSAVISITPVVTPVVSVSSSAGDTVCAGTMVTYNAMATNGGTTPGYEWKVNGVVMSGSGSSYDYTPNHGDVVSVTVNSSATCAIPASVTGVKLMTVMNVETPSISISVGPSASICKGTTAMFTATAVNGGTSPVYTWMKNGVTPMGTGATLTYAPNDNDVVVCWLNSSYRCPSVNNVVSSGITMNVDEVYIPEVQIVASPGTTIKAGQTATFTTTVANAGAAPTYKWLKNGVVINGAVQSMYSTSNLADGDSVTCIVKGSGTCGEETINSVVMSVEPTTGITTTVIGGSDIRLMPNPNNGTFTVSGTLSVSSTERVNLEVTDMLGQVVYRNAAIATNGVLNEQILLSNNMANGMYLLNISIGAERKALHFVVRK